MKRVLFVLMAILLLAGCGKDEERNDEVKSINDNMDFAFATDSLTDIWHIEDHIFKGKKLDDDRLFRFTEKYIMDEESFESLNEYEKGLATITSAIITKSIKGEYGDVELFEADLEEYHDILQNGDNFFIE